MQERDSIRVARKVASDYTYKAIYDRKANSVLVACTLNGETEVFEYPGSNQSDAIQESYNAILVRCKRKLAGG